MKKCTEYEVEGTRPKGRSKKTWREIVEKDCRAGGLNTEDAMDRSRWRKQLGMIDENDECEWVNVSSGTGSPWLSRTNSTEPQKRLCVCVCLDLAFVNFAKYTIATFSPLTHFISDK